MDFKFYFKEQLKNHPSMQFEDVIKLCYQSSFGAEHLLSDTERARAYLYAEFDAILPTDEPIFEQISPDVARVNLGAWKRESRDIDTLFNAFVNSAYINENSGEFFFSNIDEAEQIMVNALKGFNKKEWDAFLEKYKAAGILPIHHSAKYREMEKPSYRIVKIEELEKIL